MASNDGDLSPTTTNQPPPSSPNSIIAGEDAGTRTRSSTNSTGGRLRSASLRFLESSPPSGMWHATGTVLAQAPTPLEIRRGEFSHNGWDGPMQRRRSSISEESMGRLSRTPTAPTPGSQGRTATNYLDTHTEHDDEGDAFPNAVQRSKTVDSAEASSKKVPQRPTNDVEDDDDDPFSKFIGRGKIDSQSYTPKTNDMTAKDKVASKRKSADPYAIPDDDDDDLDNTTGPLRAPSKKIQALTGEDQHPNGTVNEKAPIITSENERPSSSSSHNKAQGPDENGVYPNGYKFPPKHSWGEATIIGLKAFWKFFLTPLGFLVTIYGLNVVAWGGMLFLLLIGGGQQFMCYVPGQPGKKDCNYINSPRRIWIEIDSQILNALFCVTGFGLIPWRFRDLYYLLQFRLRHKQGALRRLAGIHRSWFRLPGSEELPPEPNTSFEAPDTNPALPIPPSKAPDAPLTAVRAPATRLWKMDYVIWAYVLNTFLQAVLSGFMWGFNRYKRPSWSTGLFVALACIVAGLGGLMCFIEGKRIKAVEGVAVEEEERLVDIERDVEMGYREREKMEKKKKERHFLRKKQGNEKTSPEIVQET
ncbi:hypothetical protein MMC21_002236 [Puttea exsequens]|nr:hypothetical protein [Puttea exsequens]